MSPEQPRFTIVGAGLAGPLLACHVARAGYAVDLYEKRPDPRTGEQDAGRSINLALSVRGIDALREVGLADAVLRDAIPMRGRMIHDRSGRLTFQPYGKDDSESINSVSRAGLNVTLLDAAEQYPAVRCHFRRRCTGLDLSTTTLELTDEATGQAARLPCERVVGADGVYSAVRGAMQKYGRFDYSQEYLSHGYKELTVPPGPHGEHLLEKHALHIWPRHSFMMIALPNHDGSFTCTLFYPFEGPASFAALRTDDDVTRLFEEEFPDAVPLMPTLEEDFRNNPTGPLVTVRCRPWHVGGRVVLLGDACHAVVPFLGQGMNAAFEDCTVLAECLKQHAPDWEQAFRTFEARRKEHTDALAGLCVDNFLEMRDRVSSGAFLLRKKVEVFLHRLFPRGYLPLYTLVTFTRTPYADAVRRARLQDAVVWAVVNGLILLGLAILATWLALRSLP
jgi:kynurenine 3-monooxygenase